LAVLGAGGPARAADEATADLVRTAIEQAVQARFGRDAQVRVDDLRIVLAREGVADRLVAVPDPGARLGRRARFALQRGDGRFAGEATCALRIATTLARARRDLTRGTVLSQEDVEIVRGELAEGPLRAPPTGVVGARTTRAVGARTALVGSLLVVPPLVRSGEPVTTIVRMPGMEARGRGVASQSGDFGELVLIVNPESRRTFRARVVGRGEVEVVHGS
jgi:flagella basal body P-ring formation protein FlgA